jgi:hypothetical protein
MDNKNQYGHTVFVVLILLLGALVFGLTLGCFSVAPDDCVDVKLHDFLNSLLALSGIVIAFSLSYGVCNYTHVCYEKEGTEGISHYVFGVILSGLMLSFSAVCLSKLKSKPNTCLRSDQKQNLIGLLSAITGLSAIGFLGFGIRLISKIRETEVEGKVEERKEKKQAVKSPEQNVNLLLNDYGNRRNYNFGQPNYEAEDREPKGTGLFS